MQIEGGSMRLVAHWWTLHESHLLGLGTELWSIFQSWNMEWSWLNFVLLKFQQKWGHCSGTSRRGREANTSQFLFGGSTLWSRWPGSCARALMVGLAKTLYHIKFTFMQEFTPMSRAFFQWWLNDGHLGTLSAALPRETAFSDHLILEDQLTRVTLRDLVLPCLNNADTRVSGQGCTFLGLSWHAEVSFIWHCLAS